MFCEVTTLREAGRRLAPNEWPSAVVGELRMYSSDPVHNNLRRSLRELLHYQRVGTQLVPKLRLVDPSLLEVLGDALLMRGYETRFSNGATWEHEQLWLIRPRQDMDGPQLPPFDARPYFKSLPSVQSG